MLFPAVSLALGGIADGLDFDLDFDLDMHLPVGVFLPLRPMCIILFLILFGGAGLLLYGRISPEGSLVASSSLGYVSAVLLNFFVLTPMKKSSETAAAMKTEELIGSLCTVTTRIKPGSVGSVQITAKQGVISYTARLDDKTEYVLDEGDLAEVKDVDERKMVLVVGRFSGEEEISSINLE